MFLHGGWMHLIGNMWFLWIFGDNVEERLGSIRLHALLFSGRRPSARSPSASACPSSTAPMIGASGAIAGVLGGYVMLYPRARVVTFVAIPFLWHVRRRAGVDLPRHLVPRAVPDCRADSGVAWMAHVGGFLAGPGRGAAARAHAPAAADAAPTSSTSRRRGAAPGDAIIARLDSDGSPRKIAPAEIQAA